MHGNAQLRTEANYKRKNNVANDDPIMASMAGRYATALFQLAGDKGQIDAVEADVLKFDGLLAGSQDLQRLVKSPIFTAENQLAAVSAIAAKAGITGITGNFLKLIAKNRRLIAVPEMITAFKALIARHRGEVSAEVVSAHPLSDEQMTAIGAKLKEAVGKDVQISAKVDPTLLGGLTVKMGSRMIDSSLRTKLNNLKVAMKEVS